MRVAGPLEPFSKVNHTRCETLPCARQGPPALPRRFSQTTVVAAETAKSQTGFRTPVTLGTFDSTQQRCSECPGRDLRYARREVPVSD